MAGYEDTKQKIIDTLMGRAAGTEIQPDKWNCPYRAVP